MSDPNVNAAPPLTPSPEAEAARVEADAVNPNSSGVGSLEIVGGGYPQTVKIAYLPEALAYFNASK